MNDLLNDLLVMSPGKVRPFNKALRNKLVKAVSVSLKDSVVEVVCK